MVHNLQHAHAQSNFFRVPILGVKKHEPPGTTSMFLWSSVMLYDYDYSHGNTFDLCTVG